MTIPKIADYSMPKASEFIPNKVSWAIEPTRAVLLIHDMQQYFLGYYSPGSGLVQQLISQILRLRQIAKKLGIPVVYTAQPTEQQPEARGLLTDMWGLGIDNAKHLQPIEAALRPGPEDTVLDKWRYSAFERSCLEQMMEEQGRDQLIVCGIYAHIGCLMTAAHAFMRDIQAFLVGDALADFSRQQHMMALEYTARNCGAVVGVDDLEALC